MTPEIDIGTPKHMRRWLKSNLRVWQIDKLVELLTDEQVSTICCETEYGDYYGGQQCHSKRRKCFEQRDKPRKGGGE
jgi:hypothetical protein